MGTLRRDPSARLTDTAFPIKSLILGLLPSSEESY